MVTNWILGEGGDMMEREATTNERILSKYIFRGLLFYVSRMTSQEAILKSYNYKPKMAFLRVPRLVVEAPFKKFSNRPLFYGFRDVQTALGRAS